MASISRRWCLAFCIWLAVSGCKSNSVDVVQCVLNSQCADPLVCAFGRCREECETARDCRPRGSLCLATNEGFGVCQLSREADCSSTAQCGPGLVCESRQCTTACDEETACLEGSICTERACLADPSFDWGSEEMDAAVSDATSNIATDSSLSSFDARSTDARLFERDAQRWDRDASRFDGSQDSDSGPLADSGFVNMPFDGGPICPSPSCAQVCKTYSCLRASQVVMGRGHSCAIEASSSDVYCWGSNSDGQLGDGTTATNGYAVQVASVGARAVRVAAGDRSSCALYDDEVVRCWGSNADFRLGQPDNTAIFPTPVTNDWVSNASGTDLAFAGPMGALISTYGDINYWGPGRNLSPLPSQDFVTLYGGHTTFTMATPSGNLYGVGENQRGQLGAATIGRNVPTPVAIATSGKVVKSCSGRDHICYLENDGHVFCVGDNTLTQLGRTGASAYTPEQVSLVDSVDDLACTDFATYARVGDRVYSWGGNSVVQLREEFAGVTTASFGRGSLNEHLCAIGEDGITWCTGYNRTGALGYPLVTLVATSAPVPVLVSP